MKVGIDLHGVIDSNPRFFRVVLTYMYINGVEIHIVSGPPKVDIITELKKIRFEQKTHYKEVHSVVDFLKESGVKMWQDERGRWWTNDKDWCESKAKICDRLSLNWMLDDKEMYKPAFESIGTEFILYKDNYESTYRLHKNKRP